MIFLKKEYRTLIKSINESKTFAELNSIFEKLDIKNYSDDKVNELKEILLTKYKSINSDTFPYIIEYFYSKETEKEFGIACELLSKLHRKVEFLPSLENINLSEERFMQVLPIVCEIALNTATGITNCMYLIILNHTKYYDKIENKYKEMIKRSLYKIGMALNYIETKKVTPSKEILANIEVMVDVARLYNDSKVLKYVEKSLDLDNIEINLFSVCTLIYNNVPIPDSYIIELAKEGVTCRRFYKILRDINKLFRFPEEYLTQEHLAKSDMIYWLMHPAEIGDVPDEIELYNTFERDEEIFYVYKFKSNKEEFKDKGFMIGISGGYKKDVEPTIDNSGYTFSDFEIFDEEKYLEQSFKLIDKINNAWKSKAEDIKNNS